MNSILVSAHNPMTGPRHLGHLVSTMVDWRNLEQEYTLYLIVDDLIASILYPSGRKHIQSRTFNVVREFFATGIDQRKSHVVLTSMVPEVHELAFFTGALLDFQWLQQLYGESFCGLLGSFQRHELDLPRLASVTEATYPQIALATMTLGLGATAFQGGEEMRGYLHIMDAIRERAGRSAGFCKPKFVTAKSTFLLGTDGLHMASENAVYLSSSKSELQSAVASVKSADVFTTWYRALGRNDLAKRVKDPLDSRAYDIMVDHLIETLAPFRDFKMANVDIADTLEQSAISARELVCDSLTRLKKLFRIPGFD